MAGNSTLRHSSSRSAWQDVTDKMHIDPLLEFASPASADMEQ